MSASSGPMCLRANESSPSSLLKIRFRGLHARDYETRNAAQAEVGAIDLLARAAVR